MKKYRWLLMVIVVLFLLSMVVSPSVIAQQENALVLSEPGPYSVGTRDMTFIDENRDGREVVVTLWYPALEAAKDAAPDLSNAPYPLILYAHGHGGTRTELAYLTQHLASYGFVVAAMEEKGHAYQFVPLDVVDQPLDVLFVLGQLAALSEGDLVGAFDSNNTGVAGYSGGGYDAIMVSGAQWDDAYRLEWCAQHPGVYPLGCGNSEKIYEYRARFEPLPAEGELWQPMTDERIKAVLPLTGGPGMLFGERGLASATVPMLLIAGTADTGAHYDSAGVFVYEHWGVEERYLISVIDGEHLFGYGSSSPNKREVMHFATAFFGYYLQGNEEYVQYLTEDFVNSIEGLFWGPYGVDEDTRATMPITPENAEQVIELASFRPGNEDSMLTAVAISPDGGTIAAGYYDGTVYLLDSVQGTLLAELDPNVDEIRSIAFSPDGSSIAASGGLFNGEGERGIQVWDVATGQPTLRLTAFDDQVWGIAFSPDGTKLATGYGNPWAAPGSAKVWDTVTGNLLAEYSYMSGGSEPLAYTVFDVAFSADGTRLATANGNESVSVWDLTGDEPLLTIKDSDDHGWMLRVAFSADGKLVAADRSPSGDIIVWDASSGELVARLQAGCTIRTGPDGVFEFSPSADLLASGSDDGTIRLWDVTTWEVVAALENHGMDVYSLAFSADGTLLLTGGGDGTLRLWGVSDQ